jgi:hypothetical protein
MLFAVLAIDMGGQIGLRNIVLPACLLLLFVLRGIAFPKKYFILFFSLFIVYPTLLLMVGITKNADIGIAFSQYQSTLLAFILYVVLSGYSHISLEKILFGALALTALFAIVLAILLIFRFPGVEEWLAHLHDNSAGYFGVRPVAGAEIVNIYFKSTLFFVPAALYFLLTRQFVMYLICFLGLVLAISKTGVFFSIFILVFYLIKNGATLSKFIWIAVLSVFLMAASATPIAELFFEIFEGRSETVDVRVGHLKSVLNLFSEDPISFIFGFGLGTGFYSEGAGDYIVNFEIDHLNTIRKYGLLWSCIFFWLVFRIAYISIRSRHIDDRVMGFSLLIGFFVAGTNPVLISPIFFSLMIVTLILAERRREIPDS